MTDGKRDAEGVLGSTSDSHELHRERVRVRRRRPRHVTEARRQVETRARQRRARIVALSTGLLLLMVLGLYYGLSRQDTRPGLQGARWRTRLIASTSDRRPEPTVSS